MKRIGIWLHLVWVAFMCDCTPAKQAAAGASYADDLNVCVTENDSGATIDACTRKVEQAWGRLDAGKDGG